MKGKKTKNKSSVLGSIVIGMIYIPVHLCTLVLMSPVYLARGAGRAITASRARSIERMSGYEYEEYIARKLKKDGFVHTDLTQAGSDFGVDIIAVDCERRTVAVQCKKYSDPVGVKAVQEVYSGAGYYGCDYALVVTNSSFTPAARRLAEEIGVVLMEGYT